MSSALGDLAGRSRNTQSGHWLGAQERGPSSGQVLFQSLTWGWKGTAKSQEEAGQQRRKAKPTNSQPQGLTIRPLELSHHREHGAAVDRTEDELAGHTCSILQMKRWVVGAWQEVGYHRTGRLRWGVQCYEYLIAIRTLETGERGG